MENTKEQTVTKFYYSKGRHENFNENRGIGGDGKLPKKNFYVVTESGDLVGFDKSTTAKNMAEFNMMNPGNECQGKDYVKKTGGFNMDKEVPVYVTSKTPVTITECPMTKEYYTDFMGLGQIAQEQITLIQQSIATSKPMLYCQEQVDMMEETRLRKEKQAEAHEKNMKIEYKQKKLAKLNARLAKANAMKESGQEKYLAKHNEGTYKVRPEDFTK